MRVLNVRLLPENMYMELSFSGRTGSREIRLRARPTGLPGPENFAVASTPSPVPGDGDVLIRNRVFRVSASIRMMISEGAEAVDGVPFPALRPGDTLAEAAVGEVISAPAGSHFSRGDLVLHRAGFREFAAVPVASCCRLDGSLPDPAMYLGHGETAFAALTRGTQVRDGDTVLVTSAAGAIGSMAAMIARSLGARRVIGTTSSREKAALLCSTLGYDVALAREDGPMLEQLREAAPEGIDVALDAVGGDQLRAAVLMSRRDARIVVLGALSGQLAPVGTGRTAPVELDSFPILLRRLTLRGYSADDDPDTRAEWNRMFAEGLRSGAMTFPHVRVRGLEHAPEVLVDVIHGRYVGTVLIELP
jgi:NADPH-dependent curcumin reductase CurA